MTFDVFGYAFPHWKTCMGLMHLVAAGHRPDCVFLAPKKQLNIPTSDYRIGPAHEYWPNPAQLCEALGLQYRIIDHDAVVSSPADFGLILGARILKRHTIWAYRLGIINIHPGILPGNRGLDNFKWAIVKKLPIGATAHWIDTRVDMGLIISRGHIRLQPDTELREAVQMLRVVEMEQMMQAINYVTAGIAHPGQCMPVELSEKFSAVPNFIDCHLAVLWEAYKKEVA